MWSAWSDTAEIYLGQSLSMLKPRGKAAVVVHHAATLPLDRVLAKLADHGSRHMAPRTRLRISLGGALCPAISFAVPQGLRGWDELAGVARAKTGLHMGGNGGDFVCEMDVAQPGLAAVVPSALQGELNAWATQQGWRVASLQPLWAQASQAPAAGSAGVQGLMLQEPDSTTLLLEGNEGALHATTLNEAPDSPGLEAAARRWLASHDAAGSRLFRIGFADGQRDLDTDMPRVWAPHWYKL